MKQSLQRLNPLRNLALVILVLGAAGFTTLVVIFEPKRFWGTTSRWTFLIILLVLLLLVPIVGRFHLQQSIFPLFGSISLLVAFASLGIWIPYASSQLQSIVVQSDFYATAGQVLPVLLLATVVDIHESSSVSATQATSYLLVVATGEFWALFALGFNLTNDPFPYSVVCATLSGAIVGLAIALYGRRYGKGHSAQLPQGPQ